MTRKKKRPKHNVVIDDAIIPIILAEDKFFDDSLEDAMAWIVSKHWVRWHTIHSVRNAEGKEIAIPLELRIAGGIPENTLGWQIALIAGQRIDGFDFEPRFCDIYGVEREGWHRHVWSPLLRNASGKISVTIFRPGITFRDFVVQALKHMKIFYRKDGDSSGTLPF